jgi:hypothetical protein
MFDERSDLVAKWDQSQKPEAMHNVFIGRKTKPAMSPTALGQIQKTLVGALLVFEKGFNLSQLGGLLLNKPCKINNSRSKRPSTEESTKAASKGDSASFFDREECVALNKMLASSNTIRLPSSRRITEASVCLMFRTEGSLQKYIWLSCIYLQPYRTN